MVNNCIYIDMLLVTLPTYISELLLSWWFLTLTTGVQGKKYGKYTVTVVVHTCRY